VAVDPVTKCILARIHKEDVPVDLPKLHRLIADVIQIAGDGIWGSSQQDRVIEELLQKADRLN